jgi:LuxR family quorum-sensing transcriptional regulator LasR
MHHQPLLIEDRATADMGVRTSVATAMPLSHGDTPDNMLLTADILALNDYATLGQVNAALTTISGQLGFDGFLYRGHFQGAGKRFTEHIESNYPASWRQQYDKEFVQLDPTVLHACSALSPLIWSDDMYCNEAQRHFRDQARLNGIVEGVTFPIHSRNGDFALLNLSLSQSNAETRRHTRAMLTWGALLAAVTHEVMGRLVKQSNTAPAPKLTKREGEVLRWIAEGKSNWEISRLVSITEHGVSHHVRNLLLKFKVNCRHQAVAQAQVHGLL